MPRKPKPKFDPPPEPGPSGGRPSAFNDKLANEILKLLRRSVSRRTACFKVGIGLTTFNEWMAKGRAEPESVFGGFRIEVRKAEADAETSVVSCVQDSAQKDPWVGMAWLKLRHPERFSPKSKLELSGHPKRPVQLDLNLSALSTEELLQLREAARKAKARPAVDDDDLTPT
jgi:hypothetical protein